MQKDATNNDHESGRQDGISQYSRSWIDHLTNLVERLPGPPWGYYVGFGMLVFLIPAIILWAEDALSEGGIDPAHVYIAGACSLLLALIHYLDNQAGLGLNRMRESLNANDDEFNDLHHRLTTLPAISTLLASLVALAYVFTTEAFVGIYRLDSAESYPISAFLFRIIYLFCWCIFGVFTYHSIHQLRTINQIYTKYTHMNLFHTITLRSFSNLAALTAAIVAVVSYGWVLVNPSFDRDDPFLLVPLIALGLFSFAIFLWPQLGIHSLLAAEKERMLGEADQRFENIVTDLHEIVDKRELDGVPELNITMASLELERNILFRIPTWPWEPETVRLLVTALALPLVLWFTQTIMQSLVSP